MNPLKLFFTIFSAILAAAAVIWGVYAHNASEEKRAETVLSLLKGSKELSAMALQSAMTYPRNASSLDGDLVCAKTIEQALWSIKRFETRVDRLAVRSIVEDCVDNYRQEMVVVGTNTPEQKKWAADLEAELATIETSAKAL